MIEVYWTDDKGHRWRVTDVVAETRAGKRVPHAVQLGDSYRQVARLHARGREGTSGLSLPRGAARRRGNQRCAGNSWRVNRADKDLSALTTIRGRSQGLERAQRFSAR